MNPYQRMHANRFTHIELARRARDYQAALAEEMGKARLASQPSLAEEFNLREEWRRKIEAAFVGGLFYGLLFGAFLATLIATVAGWWH